MANRNIRVNISFWVSILFVLYVLCWPFRFVKRFIAKYILRLDIVPHIREYRRIKTLNRRLEEVENYQEWYQTAYELDQLRSNRVPLLSESDNLKWKEDSKLSSVYDHEFIINLTRLLKEAREENNVSKMLHLLRSNMFRNSGGILGKELYEKSLTGTKECIEEYTDEFIKGLEMVSQTNDLTNEKKVEFFSEARHAFGRSALFCSGGGTMGLFHTGVIRCLHEEGIMPKIISGASAGSLIASFYACKAHLIKNGKDWYALNMDTYKKKSSFAKSCLRKFFRLFKRGHIVSMPTIRDLLQTNLGDITFQEAFDLTGIVLNITVTDAAFDQFRLLNYLTAPNVLVWSAALASCSLPLIFGPSTIYSKNEKGEIIPYMPGGRQFLDGTIGADLPLKQVAEMFNVNNCIVSQTNPMILPFMDHSHKFTEDRILFHFFRFWDLIMNMMLTEFKHRIGQLTMLGIIPSAISRYFNLLMQEYSGDLTIAPIPKLWDLLNSLRNPSLDLMEYFSKKGQTATFPKVPRLKQMLKIEMKLDQHYRAAKKMVIKKDFVNAKLFTNNDSFEFSK